MEEDENNINNKKTERSYTHNLIKTSKEMLIYFYIACPFSLSTNFINTCMKRTTICPNVLYDNSEKQCQRVEASKSMHL
jgi:hypothetical protein